MASQPVQPHQFLPLGPSAPHQDITELKIRLAVLEKESTMLKVQLEAVSEESKLLKAQLETAQQESTNLKLDLATAKIRIEEQGKKPINTNLAELSKLPNADGPILVGDKKRDFMDWYLDIQPILKMIARFDNKDQIDYVVALIDESTFEKIHAFVFEGKDQCEICDGGVVDYLGHVAEYYGVGELLW